MNFVLNTVKLCANYYGSNFKRSLIKKYFIKTQNKKTTDRQTKKFKQINDYSVLTTLPP